MVRMRKTEGATFSFVAAVFLACYLAETAECYQRWKPLRIDLHKEADLTEPVGVYEGEILFGESVKGPESHLKNGTNKHSSNASVEDKAGYQADIPVFPDHAHLDAWNQMTKSLHCGADQMDFRAVGSGLQDFAVNQLNGPSLPLPRVPPNCGYNMRRLPYSLHLSIPYSGCNMLKEGGYYMLPLTWRGIPVVLSCQMPPLPPYPWNPLAGQPATAPQGVPNWFPWHHTCPVPPLPPCYPPYPWHPLAGQTSQPTTAAPRPVPTTMDPWPIWQTPGVKPCDHWHVKPSVQPATPATMPQFPLPYPFPWCHHLYHKHHYCPYWQHAGAPTPGNP